MGKSGQTSLHSTNNREVQFSTCVGARNTQKENEKQESCPKEKTRQEYRCWPDGAN